MVDNFEFNEKDREQSRRSRRSGRKSQNTSYIKSKKKKYFKTPTKSKSDKQKRSVNVGEEGKTPKEIRISKLTPLHIRRKKHMYWTRINKNSSKAGARKDLSPESQKYVTNMARRRQSKRQSKRQSRRRKYTPRLSPIEENWREGSENSPGRTDIWKQNELGKTSWRRSLTDTTTKKNLYSEFNEVKDKKKKKKKRTTCKGFLCWGR